MTSHLSGQRFGTATALQRTATAAREGWVGRIVEHVEADARSAEVDAVLAGSASYDRLGSQDQAVVRSVWAARTAEALANLDLEARFVERGWSWVELNDNGEIMRHDPTAAE